MFSLPSRLCILLNTATSNKAIEKFRTFLTLGGTFFQLRMKGCPEKEVFQTALLLMEEKRIFESKTGVKITILINDHVDIALCSMAQGVHLGQDDLPPSQARRLLGKEAFIGYSTHSIEQIRDAPFKELNYLGFGPIFPSLTKPDACTGVDLLREAVKLSPLPIIAIGGITSENAPLVFAAGAAGVAPIRDLEIEEGWREKFSFYLLNGS